MVEEEFQVRVKRVFLISFAWTADSDARCLASLIYGRSYKLLSLCGGYSEIICIFSWYESRFS